MPIKKLAGKEFGSVRYRLNSAYFMFSALPPRTIFILRGGGQPRLSVYDRHVVRTFA